MVEVVVVMVEVEVTNLGRIEDCGCLFTTPLFEAGKGPKMAMGGTERHL